MAVSSLTTVAPRKYSIKERQAEALLGLFTNTHASVPFFLSSCDCFLRPSWRDYRGDGPARGGAGIFPGALRPIGIAGRGHHLGDLDLH